MQMVVSFSRDNNVFVLPVAANFGTSFRDNSCSRFHEAVKIAHEHLKANANFHLDFESFKNCCIYAWDLASITGTLQTSRILSNVIVTITP